jgi:hypothetical protein
MIASSIITLASLPVYSLLYRQFSAVGLVMASDLGIAANCLAVAVLLHRRNLVALGGLEWREIGKALAIAVVAGWASLEVTRLVELNGSKVADLKALGLISLCWVGVVGLGLWLTKSKLPGDLRRKGKVATSQSGT